LLVAEATAEDARVHAALWYRNELLLGTSDGLLVVRFDARSHPSVSRLAETGRSVWAIAPDPIDEEVLWLVVDEALVRRSGDDRTAVATGLDIVAIPGKPVSIAVRAHDEVVVTDFDSVVVVDQRTGVSEGLTAASGLAGGGATSATLDPEGNLWITGDTPKARARFRTGVVQRNPPSRHRG